MHSPPRACTWLQIVVSRDRHNHNEKLRPGLYVGEPRTYDPSLGGSQNKMLDRRGEDSIEERDTMAEAYRNHLAAVKLLVRKRPNFAMLEFRYHEAVKDPGHAARAVNAFLGGRLDEAAMRAVVDAELYRNRRP